MKGRILCNQIKCLECGDTPFSAHVHDNSPCACGAVAADGGMSYLKRTSRGIGVGYEDMSIVVSDQLYNSVAAGLRWSQDTGRNNLGIICRFFRDLRDSGYKLVPVEVENEAE